MLKKTHEVSFPWEISALCHTSKWKEVTLDCGSVCKMQRFGLWLSHSHLHVGSPKGGREAVGKFVLTLSLHFLWPSFRAAHLAEPWGYKLWTLRVVRGRICKLENAGHCTCFCFSPFQRQFPIGCNSRLEIFMARTWGRLWGIYPRYT